MKKKIVTKNYSVKEFQATIEEIGRSLELEDFVSEVFTQLGDKMEMAANEIEKKFPEDETAQSLGLVIMLAGITGLFMGEFDKLRG